MATSCAAATAQNATSRGSRGINLLYVVYRKHAIEFIVRSERLFPKSDTNSKSVVLLVFVPRSVSHSLRHPEHLACDVRRGRHATPVAGHRVCAESVAALTEFHRDSS